MTAARRAAVRRDVPSAGRTAAKGRTAEGGRAEKASANGRARGTAARKRMTTDRRVTTGKGAATRMREAQARRTAVAVAGSGFYGAVEETAKALYIRALKDVPPDVRAALDKAYAEERHQVARQILGIVMRNVEIADERRTLVCQDTGTPIYWVSLGTRLHVDGARLADALRRGTERATREHPLRSSVCHPITRENPQTNTGFRIPVIHWEFLPDADHVELLCIPKGSGSENMTFLKMLTPADGVAGIKRFILECVVEAGANPCPPCIVGVGIGGSADACMVLAKKAAVRPIGTRNPDPHLAAMEEELLPAINALGIGPQGIGGDSTALAVHIEHAYTHITQNPVAVNMQCWRGLRAHARVYADGRAEIGV